MTRPSSCATPPVIKVRIDVDALAANRADTCAAPRCRPIWWLQMPDGREVRARNISWSARAVSQYVPAGRAWNSTDRVSAWLEVHGPVRADGVLYNPNTEK